MSTVILLIHEHPLLQRYIAHVLEQQGGYVVVTAPSSEAALRVLGRQAPAVPPDAVVTGSRQHAQVLASPLRCHLPEARRPPVVVIEEEPEALLSPAVHRVGSAPRELLLKLKAVLQPARAGGELPLEREGLRLDPAQQQAHAGHLPLALTPLTFRLLYCLMAHPGRVYTRAQLLDTVWADQGEVEERTVDVHVYRLRHQLARYGYGQLIEAVRGSGYRFRAQVPRQAPGQKTGLRFAC